MLILARDLGACFLLRFHVRFLLPATLGVTSSPPMEGVVGISPMYVHYQKEQKNNSYFGFRNRPCIWKLTLQLCAFFFKFFFGLGEQSMRIVLTAPANAEDVVASLPRFFYSYVKLVLHIRQENTRNSRRK